MSRPAVPPPARLARWGIDPDWSRLIQVPDGRGSIHTWHVLDTGARLGSGHAAPATIVCVHGNPTWSILWRSFLDRMGDRYRVIAVDQLGMGFSDRTPPRGFATRVADLGNALSALHVDGPVIVAAHDWGGPISLGWAIAHRERVGAVVLCNTGVAVPAGRRAPTIIRIAAAGPVTDVVCHRTRTFVDATLALSGRRVGRAAREGYRAPYRSASSRQAIADFVDDIPFRDTDPSASAVAMVATGITSLTAPVLVTWGAKDPVFGDDFALDLSARLPHADLHRHARAGHLVVEETDLATLVDEWLGDRVLAEPSACPAVVDQPTVALRQLEAGSPVREPIWSGLVGRAGGDQPAFVAADGATTSFAELHDRVMATAAGLSARGVRAGDRVAILVPPGVELLTTVYACWRVGAVTVIADRGLGLSGLGRAVRAARVQWVIGPGRAVAVARILRWAPGSSATTIARLHRRARSSTPLPPEPQPDDPAAVLYTSGATGPPKGVCYRHGQISAQRDALRDLYGITAGDRLVAAFAPFALYGPAFGITSTIPDVDVSRPGALTAAALTTAIGRVGATIVFAAPAALANVARTAPSTHGAAGELDAVRLVLSAGAPVSTATVRATAQLFRRAEVHTPYGMTECLPVADIDAVARGNAQGGSGVCVGRPARNAEVLIAPLDFAVERPVTGLGAGTTGEVLVRAPWLSDGYDRMWAAQHRARPVDLAGRTWHRTGDVGHLDGERRLWIEGRDVHVVHTAAGPVTPVPVEVSVEVLDGLDRVAAVGVGPRGCQQLVVVVEDPDAREGLASGRLAAAVRARVLDCGHHAVAAVLTVALLPVDIRHNTKIDRSAVARWAADVLSGDRTRRPW